MIPSNDTRDECTVGLFAGFVDSMKNSEHRQAHTLRSSRK